MDVGAAIATVNPYAIDVASGVEFTPGFQDAALIRRFILGADEHIALIGDGNKDLDGNITVGIDRTIYRHLDDIIPKVGFLVVDQCHIANLKIFYQIVLL